VDRLAVTLSGLTLPNPILCGSGEHVMTGAGIRAALAAGAAGVVAKSINESAAAARQLDRADYAVLGPDGDAVPWRKNDLARDSLFNRSGLAGHDPAAWFAELAALDGAARRDGRFVAASVILGGDPAATVRLARLAGAQGLRILELNAGAPHASEAAPGAIAIERDPARLADTVAAVKQAFGGILWVKLTGLSDNLAGLAAAAKGAGADAVGLMGRFMAMVPDLDTLRPVLGTSAAYGGRWALPITCRWLALSRRAVGPVFPLIGTNGARTGRDVARMVLAGASAVEMTSAVLQGGFAALGVARDELAAWLGAKDFALRDIVGRAADALESYGEQPARPGRWRDFVPPETLRREDTPR
jgi:dihydroorotate dehydrogenase (NAD+) catalytic subunit